MQGVSLKKVARYCDRLLEIDGFDDWPGACNGLQMENRGGVSHVAAAVDASLSTVRMALYINYACINFGLGQSFSS